MPTDAELLHRYVRAHDERAFAALVARHVGLVYAAALRRTNGRIHLAEEISQAVFSQLARHAPALRHHPALTGWLYRSTRNAAIDALRAELRRQKLAQSLVTMPDTSPPSEPPVDWAHLRPVLDEAMDQLKERDRELMLLRYFNGLTFAEVGARLNLAENTARMRTGRALDRLRRHLDQRGVTSTSAALGLLLANQTLAAAPAGLAATVAAAALATAPAGATAGIIAFFFMSKLTLPVLSAALAAATTALLVTTNTHTVSAAELAALRSENARLAQATAAGATVDSVAAVADEYATQATAIAEALKQRHAQNSDATHRAPRPGLAAPATATAATNATTARGHRDHGQATARDAMLSFAWAGDIADPAAIAKLIYFDGHGRDKALAVLASMPPAIREQYRTPEELYGLFLAAETLVGPPPGADVLERSLSVVEIRPDRAVMRRLGDTNTSSDPYRQYQLTSDGWKWVIAEPLADVMPRSLNSETLARLSAHTP